MKRSVVLLLVLASLAPTVSAQFSIRSAQDLGDASRRAMMDALAVGDFTVQELSMPERATGTFAVDVVLDGQPRKLLLHPHSVRASGFKLVVQDEDGYHDVEPAAPVTVRGRIQGIEGSVVAGALVDGQLEAQVMVSRELPMLGIQPASRLDPTQGGTAHVVYSSRDNLPQDFTCGTPSLSGTDGGDGGGTPPPPGGLPEYDTAEIACDSDVEFYNANGQSVNNTQNDIENIINATAAIYEVELNLTYEITNITVRTAEPDPYGTAAPSSLLSVFSNEWIQNQGSVERDVAHLFTGKNLTGSTIGIAYLNVLCGNNAYGLSQSKYTGNFTNRTGLTAHELGHNWNANHCDGQASCRIMCSGLGGCGPVTTFGFSATQSITEKANNVSCLDLAPPPNPPVLNSLSNNTFEVLSNGFIVVNGNTLEDITSVTIGDQTLDPLLDYDVLSDSQVRLYPPLPTGLGPTPITLHNVLGASNSLDLDYLPSDPPVISGFQAALLSVPYHYDYAGRPGDTAYLIVSPSPVVFNYLGFDILQDLIILHIDALGGIGTSSFNFPLPASAVGVTFYSQIATLDGTETFIGASNILSTIVVPF